MNPKLSVVKEPPPEPVELVERRREKARARTIARIGRTPPHKDEKTYPGGHFWQRYRSHVDMVLRVKEALEA